MYADMTAVTTVRSDILQTSYLKLKASNVIKR